MDSQLKTSRRFDAPGIQQDHPELFLPYPRRSPSGSSSSSASSVYSNKDTETKQQDEEGQLRYWTPEMCSRSPQLFDFVVTVRSLPMVHHPNIGLTIPTPPAWRRWHSPLHFVALPTNRTSGATFRARLPWFPHKFRLFRPSICHGLCHRIRDTRQPSNAIHMYCLSSCIAC